MNSYDLALFISDLFNPIAIFTSAILLFGSENFIILLIIASIFFGFVPEWIITSQGTRAGSSGRQRLVMQSQFVACILAGLVLLVLFNAPKQVIAYAASFSLGQLIVLLFVPFWKISGDAFGKATSLAFLYGLGIVPLPVAVIAQLIFGWARVRIGAHTPLQYVAGTAGGLLISWIAILAIR